MIPVYKKQISGQIKKRHFPTELHELCKQHLILLFCFIYSVVYKTQTDKKTNKITDKQITDIDSDH